MRKIILTIKKNWTKNVLMDISEFKKRMV